MNTKRFTAALAALLLGAALSFGLMLCMLVPAGAETGEPGEWNNYTVVTDEADGSFVGVNIHDDTSAALSAVIPTGAATYAASSDEGFSGAFATITFELEPFSVDDYTGILVQLDRRHASANTGPRFFLEDENGLLYRFNSGSNRSDVLIRADGRVSSWQNEKSRYTLTSVEGTLYVPFTSIISTGTKTPESTATPVGSAGAIPEGTVFTRFHYALDTRSNGFYGDTRPTAFGTIAAVSAGETVQVTKLLGMPELSYTVDPADTESDVNLADMTKGKTVYARHTFSGTYVFDENADYIARVNDVLEYDRLPAKLTVNYADGDGAPIREAETLQAEYNAATGKFDYTVTAPSVNGYVYESTSLPLTGSLDGNGTITLTYSEVPAPEFTLRYVDEEGNAIAAEEEGSVEYDAQSDTFSYSVEPANVFAYEYLRADLPLEGTIEENTVLTLTYRYDGLTAGYDVISDGLGGVAGINLKNSLTGALVVDVTSYDASTGYGLVTVEIGEVDPSQSSGILLQFAQLSDAGSAQVRMYLEDSEGNLYRLFTVNNDVTNAGDSVLITPSGEISAVTNDAQNNRHMFTAGMEGTIYIPWTSIATIGSGSNAANSVIPEGTVFTKFHFGREMRYNTSVSRPIALGMLAEVKIEGENAVVRSLCDFTGLTYSNDAEDAGGDVNLADLSQGKIVYSRMWLTGTHVAGDAQLLETVNGIWSWTRKPPQITLVFVNEDGDPIRGDSVVDTEYAAGGSAYTVAPPVIVGYEYVSASAPLEGTADADFTITLTYKATMYTITIEYVDENGSSIRENATLQGVFGDYIEIEPAEIEGYTYSEATTSLKLTVVGEKTIRLIYTSDNASGGGCSSAMIGAAAPAGIMLAAAVTAVLAKKKRG